LLDPQASTIGNPYLFTGRRLDAETGLYYYRARMYDAKLGRFVSRDPIGYHGGLSVYCYVLSSPTASLDPLGLEPEIVAREWLDDENMTILNGMALVNPDSAKLPPGVLVRFKQDLSTCSVEFLDVMPHGTTFEGVEVSAKAPVSLGKIGKKEISLEGGASLSYAYRGTALVSEEHTCTTDDVEFEGAPKDWPKLCCKDGELPTLATGKKITVEIWRTMTVTVKAGGTLLIGYKETKSVAISSKVGTFVFRSDCSCACLGDGWGPF
ncbi:MAG: RHS repeat-associated core domain-containing protein, partial [Planctomycetes bacterium]|nr:RHS repeat-associated core domain-containing protein [Planctomycetota bacterium]